MIGRRRAADKDLDTFSYGSREASEHPFGAEMDNMPFGPDVVGVDLDLGLDFGDGLPSEREKTPGQTRWLQSQNINCSHLPAQTAISQLTTGEEAIVR